jgi:hypothetical protein
VEDRVQGKYRGGKRGGISKICLNKGVKTRVLKLKKPKKSYTYRSHSPQLEG